MREFEQWIADNEITGFPALGVIDQAALDPELGKRLWEAGLELTVLNDGDAGAHSPAASDHSTFTIISFLLPIN